MIMRHLGDDKKYDLRTIGVTKLGIPVVVDKDPNGENFDGIGYSVLVVKVIPEDLVEPDTEEIFRATDDAWVGDQGYVKEDGTIQRARAFIGKTKRTLSDGTVVSRNEVFIVDIPEDITVVGPNGPLEGTDSTFPMPPKGTEQRMLTKSDSDCSGTVRATKDGSRLVYKKADANDVSQLFLISPLGGESTQATSFDEPVGSFRWHPSGNYLVCSSGNSVYVVNVIPGDPSFGKSYAIGDIEADTSANAIVCSPDGEKVAYNRSIIIDKDADQKAQQIFVTDFKIPETW